MATQPIFEIDKGIAIPDRVRKGTPEKYPWSKCEIGDSFFVADGNQPLLSNLCYAAKKRGRGAFTTAKVDGGVRVWRIA